MKRIVLSSLLVTITCVLNAQNDEKYDWVRDFSEGFAMVELNGKIWFH
jgi:hypothetical protein